MRKERKKRSSKRREIERMCLRHRRGKSSTFEKCVGVKLTGGRRYEGAGKSLNDEISGRDTDNSICTKRRLKNV